MKTKILAFIVCCLAFITACEKDGDIIKVSGLSSSELLASESSVVLTKEASATSVLALTWSKSSLSISDASMSIPNSVPKQIMEVSASNAFITFTEITPQGTTYSFNGAVLNTLAKNLGFTAGVSAPLYFRIRMAYGNNTKVFYSNVTSVNVTCYSIDMSIGFILNADKEDTGFTLYSPDSDGEYSGFTGSGAWFNWHLLEGDGTIWGNLGVDDNAFVISDDASSFWKLWYPGQGGCYYTTLSTGNEEWTATYIPSLTVSGDIDATMTFDKAAVKWYLSFTTTTANAKIKVSGNASLYNKTTSTTDADAIAKTIGFIPAADSTLTFEWNNASAGEITFAEAGDYTLTLNLSDPKKWTYSVKSGITVIVEPISKFLYLPGIDDGISGSWTFNNYLNLVSEDDSTFAGAVLVNSLWGYNMSLISGEWAEVYKMGATEGTLAFKGASDITAPSAGLYLIQADLANLTYSHTAITGMGYSGLNDSWASITAMNETLKPGVYSSTVTISTVSAWGFKFYLNNDWNINYGGASGVLKYAGANITDDATLGVGTYDVIVNTRNAASYVFLGDVVYVSGINDDWSLSSAMTLSKTSVGVYSGTIVVTKASSYGMTIQLDKSWARYFGGSFSSLSYLGANITDDQSLAAGTYTVTVDFINNTCAFVAK